MLVSNVLLTEPICPYMLFFPRSRRTFKDVITFIPFVIILLIPLSPIGHVLVFGAIQRFFPDFFPSCFTEQRQNLLQLYETAEYSELVINENWNVRSIFFCLGILSFVRTSTSKLKSFSFYPLCVHPRLNYHVWRLLWHTLWQIPSVRFFSR
jgi:hypothetical protein